MTGYWENIDISNCCSQEYKIICLKYIPVFTELITIVPAYAHINDV